MSHDLKHVNVKNGLKKIKKSEREQILLHCTVYMYLCFLIISQLSEVAKGRGTLNIGVLNHALKPLSVPLGYIIKARAQHLHNPTS